MKKINKSEEPKFFRNFIKKNRPVNWDGINEIRPNLREHILESEQNWQCAYCESAITAHPAKSEIDHFRLKHLFPELTFNYKNLLVSCKNPDHCASTKDSEVKSKEVYQKIVNPVDENPNEFFEYNLSSSCLTLVIALESVSLIYGACLLKV